MPDKLHELQRLWLIEATKYNVLPLDDRARRAPQPRSGRPAAAHQGRLAAALRRHGPAVREQRRSASRTSRSRSPPRSSCPTAGAEGRRSSPRAAAFGGWSLYAKDGKAEVRLQLPRHRRVHDRGATRRSRPATTRCGWSSPTTAAAWPRAARHPLLRRQPRSATGRVEPTAADRLLGRRDHRRRPRDRHAGHRRLRRADTSRFNGQIDWVQIDVGDDDHGHLIDPEEYLHVIMTRQ